jgi:hypothetical protein
VRREDTARVANCLANWARSLGQAPEEEPRGWSGISVWSREVDRLLSEYPRLACLVDDLLELDNN